MPAASPPERRVLGDLLIFDGDCGFCTTSANWAKRRFRHGERAEPWQLLGDQALESFGLTLADVQQAAWWVDAEGNCERGHRAAGRVLQAGGGWPAIVGWLALTPPTSWLAAGIYRLVVRWRYRLPGGTPACQVAGKSPGVRR
jgi:predicted DCC family thiol-disulfide oxidoreductase YuxK